MGDTGVCESCGILGYTAIDPHVPLPLGPQWSPKGLGLVPDTQHSGSAQGFGPWNCSQEKPGANDCERGSKNGQEIDKCVQAEMQIKAIR